MKSKERNPYKGQKRNVEQKKMLFKAAVGQLIKSKGVESLTLNKIATEASFSKNLIHRYFGNHKNLIDQYCEETEFWLNKTYPIQTSSKKEQITLLKDSLKQQFLSLNTNSEARKLMLWEITENNFNTLNLARKKEELGEIYLKESDKLFSDTIDIRAICAILVAAVNYLGARTAVQESKFCGIVLKEEEDRIFNMIDLIIDLIIK
ncbi:TetR/AcrR family transcriptional regulator [Sphingobacterium multivorum]|uniref:TetR/AcrR family transcriptional regulator n=1 Tax=Sphingobacterium multivorum TaxID=28454 RepID=A0ABX7CTJ8_SPHMU|nr:helix-turn-helix domain-containing protein [Sphingobacterium multivorum]QQT55427.1 TetR/AcrR family transcriptional regulator [Sphingobacterium multivorum]